MRFDFRMGGTHSRSAFDVSPDDSSSSCPFRVIGVICAVARTQCVRGLGGLISTSSRLRKVRDPTNEEKDKGAAAMGIPVFLRCQRRRSSLGCLLNCVPRSCDGARRLGRSRLGPCNSGPRAPHQILGTTVKSDVERGVIKAESSRSLKGASCDSVTVG